MTATTAQRQAYAKKLAEISKRFDGLEEATVRQMQRLLNESRKLINGRVAVELAAGNEPTAAMLADMVSDVGAMMDSLDASLINLTENAMSQSSIAGQQFFIEPFNAAGINTSGFVVRPSIAQVNILTEFTNDLITQTTADMRKAIASEIRFAAMSGRSSLKAMQNINRIVGGGPGFNVKLTKGVSYRAERIYRTEMNRAFSVANDSQQQAAVELVPDLQKRWTATGDSRTREDHLAAHGQIVDVDEPFIIDGEKLDYPHDPKAPASQTINCRCRSVTVHPDIGPIETPVDKKVARERNRRNDEVQTKKDKKTAGLDLSNKADIEKFLSIELGRETNPVAHIRPQGRAPRGQGQIFKDRRAIANKIENHIRMRSQHQAVIDTDRGTKKNRQRVTIARERKAALSQAIDTSLQVADGPGDWAFKRELVDGVFSYASATSTGR